MLRFCLFCCLSVGLLLPGTKAVAADPTAIASWTKDVEVRPVSGVPGRHTIHSYYLANPESPDGRKVLFFASSHKAGYVGDIVILDRETGEETILAREVNTEDAHRAACQQWLSGGKRVAWHQVVDGRWQVLSADVATGAIQVVAQDRQVGFGHPDHDLLPLYGCHWNPGPHRDLEIWDAGSDTITKPIELIDVKKKYGDWMRATYPTMPTSIFFPVLSPDGQRLFFKMAGSEGGEVYMSKNASVRHGLFCVDLNRGELLSMRERWGHPAWFPDSQRIIEVGNLIIDSTMGDYTRIPEAPRLRGSHPTVSPDGKLMATDGMSEPVGGKDQEWGIMVADIATGKWALLHSFDQSRGAASWRRSHPHPVFSKDSKRIYYNVSSGEFTQLYVAERR